jgi:hypothetical protein
MMTRARLIIIGTCMELAYLSFYVIHDPVLDVAAFVIVNACTYLMLAILVSSRRKFEAPEPERKNVTPLILGFAILFRLTLVFHGPVGSDDIFRYIWDGKVTASGINPYSLPPNAQELSPLHTQDLPSRISFPEMRTIYPPLAQAFFWLSSILFGDSVVGMKFLLLIADLLTMIILLRLLRLQDSRLETIILYAWSPVPVMYLSLDGHIDALGIPFLLLFLVFLSAGKKVRGGISLGLSALAKLYPLILVPLLVRMHWRIKQLWLPLLPLLVVALGYLFYFEPTGGLFESLIVYNSTFSFNGPIFTIVLKLLGSNDSAHLLCGALSLSWLLALCLLNRPIIASTILAFLGFLLLSPTVHPWYFTWIAALLVLRWSTATFVLLGLSNLSNIVVYQYRSTGVWRDQEWLLLLEYLPFFVLLFIEIKKNDLFSRNTSIPPWTPTTPS